MACVLTAPSAVTITMMLIAYRRAGHFLQRYGEVNWLGTEESARNVIRCECFREMKWPYAQPRETGVALP